MTSSAPTLDLDAYFARIGYAGPRTPSLATLAGVHERHAQVIPFENLDVVLGRPIPLDLPSVERKLVRDHRGGYCFEQNTLFAAALRALGFVVTPMLARVRWQVPPEMMTPQTHVALRVDLDGKRWLVDAGFGSVGLLAPLDLDSTDVQQTRFEPRRLMPHGRNLLQQVRLGDTWTDVCILYPDDAYAIDLEVANWFTSTYPGSRFRQNVMAARAEGGLRFTLFNRELGIRRVDGSVEKRILASPDELLGVLAEHFGLHFHAETRFPCAGLVWG